MKTFTLSGLRLRPALISALACLLLQGAASAGFSASAATPRNAGKVYVDKSGRMRLSSDRSDALSRHVNPFTGKSYADDPAIIAMEINNEPCHSTSTKQVTDYVNSMASTLRRSGWRKPMLC